MDKGYLIEHRNRLWACSCTTPLVVDSIHPPGWLFRCRPTFLLRGVRAYSFPLQRFCAAYSPTTPYSRRHHPVTTRARFSRGELSEREPISGYLKATFNKRQSSSYTTLRPTICLHKLKLSFCPFVDLNVVQALDRELL